MTLFISSSLEFSVLFWNEIMDFSIKLSIDSKIFRICTTFSKETFFYPISLILFWHDNGALKISMLHYSLFDDLGDDIFRNYCFHFFLTGVSKFSIWFPSGLITQLNRFLLKFTLRIIKILKCQIKNRDKKRWWERIFLNLIDYIFSFFYFSKASGFYNTFYSSVSEVIGVFIRYHSLALAVMQFSPFFI